MKKSINDVDDLICPFCGENFIKLNKLNKIRCENCGKTFYLNVYGFIEFPYESASVFEIDTTNDEYIEGQKICNAIVYKNYIKPLLKYGDKVLDVGCGIGTPVCLMRNDGHEAYGVDLPSLSKYWYQNKNDPKWFICSDAAEMPFPDNYFDLVYSFGVIEHIGTKTGHCTLSEDYKEERQKYADEIIRVTKHNGKIIISCPNKSFPIDICHGPSDSMTENNIINKVRQIIMGLTGLNFHNTWGEYHLLSYSEIEQLFITKGRCSLMESLSLEDYFSFCSFNKGAIKVIQRELMKFYFKYLPTFLRTSFLNPYVLVQIIK